MAIALIMTFLYCTGTLVQPLTYCLLTMNESTPNAFLKKHAAVLLSNIKWSESSSHVLNSIAYVKNIWINSARRVNIVSNTNKVNSTELATMINLQYNILMRCGIKITKDNDAALTIGALRSLSGGYITAEQALSLLTKTQTT